MLTTILIFIVALALWVISHEFGHFIAAKKLGVTVHEFAFGFKPRLFSWKRGGTEYAINLLPLGGYVRLEGEDENTGKKGALMALSPGKRIIVFVAGVVMNLILAWVLLMFAYGIGSYPLTPSFDSHAGEVSNTKVTIVDVVSKIPASEVGLRPEDVVVAINNEPIDSAAELSDLLKQSAGAPTTLTFIREGQNQAVTVTPRQNPPAGEGVLGIKMTAQPEKVRVSWYKAPWVALQELGSEITGAFISFGQFIGQLIQKHEVSDQVTGIVGVGVSVGIVRQMGLGTLLQFAALVSTSLAVINILPFPPLDGGHVLFTVIEWIRKKPVEAKYRQWVTLAGLAAILLLFVVVTYQDLLNFAIIERISNLF